MNKPNLHSATARADLLRTMSAITPSVNYQFKDDFLTALRDGDALAAWEAAFNAGIKEGTLQTARKRFKEYADG